MHMGWISRKNALFLLIAIDEFGALFGVFLGLYLSATKYGPIAPEHAFAHVFLTGSTLVVNAAFFSIFSLYGGAALFRRSEMVKFLLEAVTATAMFIVVFGALSPPGAITPVIVIVYWLTMLCVGAAGRILVRDRLMSKGGFQENARATLIVGANERGRTLAREFMNDPALGRRLLGFVDDGWRDEAGPGGDEYQIVADFASFKEYLRNNVVDEAVICLPLESLYQTASAVVAACQEQGVTVTISTHLFNVEDPRMRPTAYAGDLTLTVYSSALDARAMMIKRIMDMVISSLALVVLSPVFLAAWTAIRLTSAGPAIFTQKRVGLNKRVFRFYKFRTMVQNAEALQCQLEDKNETKGATFKMRCDPRITLVGRFLRKTSIDELPQLVNVLRGDMSLVGPRPLPIRDVRRIEKDWPRRRFSVKPGITCIWQISGRNSIPFEGMMAMDIEYIDHWSLLLDVEILAKTIPVVLSGRGAY